MKLLMLDFETTWENPVDVRRLRITEIGAVLFDWESHTPLKLYSEFVWDTDYPESPPELVELTGIKDYMLKDYGKLPKRALLESFHLMEEADFIVAHNGSQFDKPLYYNECERHVVPASETPWIDTRTDIPFPKSISSRKLQFLAAEHGFLNPFSHRAVFDCLTMAEVLKRYDIHQVIELAKQPMIHAIAKVAYQDRGLAKDAGYYWNGDLKEWFKPMKESQFEQEKEKQPFVVEMRYAEQ